VRAFPVNLPSGQRYWTVLDEDLQVVGVADEYLRHLRFGRDAAESTTKAYAYSIVLFLRWCARSGRVLAGRCRAVRVVHHVASRNAG
jgi:integrase/recombinase XerD